MDERIIRKQLPFVLESTDFGIGKSYRGKVRDSYVVDGKRIMIVTDRLSAFDVVLTTLPFKGQVLNQMSAFWFDMTRGIVRNHVLEVPDPNVTVAIECAPVPVEFVVRGYVTGVTATSIWHNYSRGVRDFCGNTLPEGLRKDQKLPSPLVTPTTKAGKGSHDESISRSEIVKRGLMDGADYDEASETALKLFELGTRVAAGNGIILVDTKYEFGRDAAGNLVLIDEIHTPDSSRFWYADTYKGLYERGGEQRRIDKEYVRKWCADNNYVGSGHVPDIPDGVRVEAARRYIEAFEQLTGMVFSAEVGDALGRIRANLERRGYL